MKKITFAALAVPLMWVLLLLLYFNSNKIHAQETIVLSGVVKSADGTPIEGVTVWQKDTNNGTQTDLLGFYSLEVSSDSYIVFEYIGFKTQTIRVTGKVLNVTLVSDDDTLEELVINAGYYSVKDKERTGSISKITSKEIGQQPVANPLAAMQGRMAGVNITQSSGTPGGGFDIQIRGRNSLRTEGNAPLYIVDGVPYASQSMSDSNIAGGILPVSIGSPLNSIDPNNIESIEVLKDADATAIYGSRGSNGVVLITTKKGSSDKTSVTVQSTTSVSSVAKYMDLMNTDQYLKMRRDAFANDGITEYPANAYDVNGTWDQNRYTDWQREFIGNSAVSQNTQFSLSGGTNRTTFVFSASNRKDGTVFPGNFGYSKNNFMVGISHMSKNEKLSVQMNMQKGSQKNRLMVYDLSTYSFLAPNAPALYGSDNNLNWENNTFTNPLAKLNERYTSQNDDFTGRVLLNYNVTKNFKFNLSGGLNQMNSEEARVTPSSVHSPHLNVDSSVSSLTRTNTALKSWIIEPGISWSKHGEKARWEGVVGGTFEGRNLTGFGLQASNFTSDALIDNAANAASLKILKDTETIYKYVALYGRLNLTYLDKYILNLTGRRDGSSRFAPENRFANFGAVGGAWLFSREKLFEGSSWFTFGKLRASYGIAGSDLIGDYQYLNTYGISINNYDGISGLEPLRLYNPDFSWENNKKLEAALELEFFNGRLAPTIAWYRNRSSNQLVAIPLPGTTGFGSVQGNFNATVENSGWEFTLRSTNIFTNDFQWSTSFNLSIPDNKLIAFPNLKESTYADLYEVGHSLYLRKLYNFLGVNKETGLYEVEDVNNDGVINTDDRTSLVEVGTKYFGGLSNHFSYRKWSLDFLWQFTKQNGYTADFYRGILGSSNNALAYMDDYWSPENPDARYQKPSTGANTQAAQAFQRYRSSTGIVTDKSFIRLKSVQLMYAFKWESKKLDVNIFAQGLNLFTITSYQGIDPESVSGFLPPLKTFAFGVNVKF